jgi:O-antigen/teichoic acid export membrane protein
MNEKLRLLMRKVCEWGKYLRLHPFDTSTETGREQERHRRIAISSVSAFVGQGVNYAVMIAMVPLLIRHLGQEQYGLWLAVSSMATFTAFADLGLGNGLINVLGKAHGLDDRTVAREYVSSGFFILTGVAVILGIVGGLIIPAIDWNRFFHLETEGARAGSTAAVLIFFFLFVINLPVSIVQKIQMAYQENYVNSLWMAAGKLAMLAGAVAGVMTNRSLLYFVTVLTGAPLGIWLMNGLVLFGRHRPWLRPGIRFISRVSAKELLRTGFFFFVTGISGVLAIQIDTLVIGRFLGAGQVPVYAIPLRLFMICTTLLGFVLMPLWPAYREAIVRGDMLWVRKTFKRTLRLTFVTTVPAAILLVFLTPGLIYLWTGTSLMIPRSLLLALGVHAVMTALTGPMAMLLNGANILGFRALFSLINGIFNLTVSVFLVRRIGVAGPVWGTVIAQLLFGWTVSFYYLSKLLRKG